MIFAQRQIFEKLSPGIITCLCKQETKQETKSKRKRNFFRNNKGVLHRNEGQIANQ